MKPLVTHSQLVKVMAVIVSVFLVGFLMGLSLSVSVCAASFDCRPETLKPAEQLICHDPHLSRLDDQMVQVYKKARRKGTYPGLRNEQRSWLRHRNACGYDVVCLHRAYNGRIVTLRFMLK